MTALTTRIHFFCLAVIAFGEALVLKRARLVARPIYPTKRHAYSGKVKFQSMVEANLTCMDVSLYGAGVPKIPESIVTQVSALKKNFSAKIHKFNFQGALYRKGNEKRRDLILSLARNFFTPDDMLVVTDAPDNYSSVGPYDHTKGIKGFNAQAKGGFHGFFFDSSYYSNMIQSTFTVALAGDVPWSMRFYEAALAGSIPVIHSVEDDLLEKSPAGWFAHIGYTYFTLDEVTNMSMSNTETKKIIDKNYDLVIKYQTWIHGDQVPPAYEDKKQSCSSDSKCNSRCPPDDPPLPTHDDQQKKNNTK